MADLISSVSGSPYTVGSYNAESNSKNTLTIESYFKLLASQLANQDMTNPMDNSEMMAQMTQMAMVQSLGTLTSSMKEQMAFSKSSYLTGLIGKTVTAKLPADKNDALAEEKNETRSGELESVNLSGSEPTFRLKGDLTDYPLENLLMITGDGVESSIKEIPETAERGEKPGGPVALKTADGPGGYADPDKTLPGSASGSGINL